MTFSLFSIRLFNLGVTFSIAKFNQIRDNGSCSGTECDYSTFAETDSVNNFLDLFAKADHSEYCLGYIFVNRDFPGDSIGLAYTPSDGKFYYFQDLRYTIRWKVKLNLT